MRSKLTAALFIATVIVSVGVDFALADAARPKAPNASEITTAANNGMDNSFEIKNSADTTETGEDSGTLNTATPIALLNADIAAAQQTARFQQNITVHNFDGSAKLCVFAITDHTSGSCASSSGSCFADSNTRKSIVIPAGKTRSLRFGGDVRLCAIATANSINWQAERYLTGGK